ncbi:MAG: hypothetical protein ACP5I2_03440 [Fervidicoccaceae archaeon]
MIKILIRNGVKLAKSGSLSSGVADVEKINELFEKLSSLENSIGEIQKQFERQGKIQASMIKALEERTASLEFAIEELEEKIDKEKQVIHPQLIDNWSSSRHER